MQDWQAWMGRLLQSGECASDREHGFRCNDRCERDIARVHKAIDCQSADVQISIEIDRAYLLI